MSLFQVLFSTKYLYCHQIKKYMTGWEPGSSVRIMSDYELDDQAIEVRSPAEAKDFSSSLCVHTGSAAEA
jgi:hypothetical protein